MRQLHHVLFVLAGLLLAHRVQAAESASVVTSHDTATLVSRSDSFIPGRPVTLGLRLRLAPGWHTYWSNPGDAGEAPSLRITASGLVGVAADRIDWPTPERLPDGPLMSYGYTGDALLPVTLRTAAAPAGTLHLIADAEWLVCATVCIPRSATFRLDLPQGDGALSAQAPLFARAEARRPLGSPFNAELSAGHRLLLSGRGLGPQSVHDAWFFPAAPGLIDQIAAQPVTVTEGQVAIALTPAPGLAGSPGLGGASLRGPGLRGVLVLRDAAGNESYLGIDAARVVAASAWRVLPRLLLLALLGGIVLNLMPCVFPVLAMKAVALTRLSGAARSERRTSAGYYTAGVLVAFASLGALMLGLRAAGSAVGWGFQFQSVIFVAATCWLLFGVGLNLAGLFEISGGVAGLGQGLGQGLAARRGHGGDFATGLLAVLVATPCTAPFMGVAIAGALAAPPGLGMLVFLAMGLGLALPYGLVAMVPSLAARLPRPGAWMDLLRQALAFPVFATCAWLAWVAAIEGGDRAVLILGSGLVLLAMAGWLLGLAQRLSPRRPVWLMAASALSAVAALALLPTLTGAQAPVRPGQSGAQVDAQAGAQADASGGTEPFSETRLAALRAQHRPVFVDMTAAWCVTCLVNERIALQPAAVRAAFAARNVATLRGDWTSRDAAITGFLRAHDRDGVPLYVYYPAGAEGRVLPQILTAGRVLDEIGAIAD